MNDRLYFMAAASFEAARRLERLSDEQRLHGHSFLARVRAELPTGFAPFPGAEAEELTERLRKTVAPLDYTLLNEHVPMRTWPAGFRRGWKCQESYRSAFRVQEIGAWR